MNKNTPPTAWERWAELDDSFMERGACRNESTAVFFSRNQQARARLVCAGCPVRVACLDFALDAGIAYGVWGGLNAEDRTRYAQEHDRLPITLAERDPLVMCRPAGAEEDPAAEDARRLAAEGFTVREVAELLHRPQGTVKRWVRGVERDGRSRRWGPEQQRLARVPA